MGSINSRPLKAYVRFDGSGRIVAGSLILRKNKPKVGKWKEIPAYECCNPTTTTSTTAAPTTTTSTTVAPTTTTTTTAAPTTTTTTTLEVFNFIGRGGDSSVNACNGSNETFYTTGPLNFIYPQNGNVVYFDQALTQLVTYAYIASPGVGQVFDCTNGVLSNQQNCV
jgi:hypothetical protein